MRAIRPILFYSWEVEVYCLVWNYAPWYINIINAKTWPFIFSYWKTTRQIHLLSSPVIISGLRGLGLLPGGVTRCSIQSFKSGIHRTVHRRRWNWLWLKTALQTSSWSLRSWYQILLLLCVSILVKIGKKMYLEAMSFACKFIWRWYPGLMTGMIQLSCFDTIGIMLYSTNHVCSF